MLQSVSKICQTEGCKVELSQHSPSAPASLIAATVQRPCCFRLKVQWSCDEEVYCVAQLLSFGSEFCACVCVKLCARERGLMELVNSTAPLFCLDTIMRPSNPKHQLSRPKYASRHSYPGLLSSHPKSLGPNRIRSACPT